MWRHVGTDTPGADQTVGSKGEELAGQSGRTVAAQEAAERRAEAMGILTVQLRSDGENRRHRGGARRRGLAVGLLEATVKSWSNGDLEWREGSRGAPRPREGEREVRGA
ncbi:hypothetical protein E2562_034262 [Oryza meyeriana var. granulata]|uniref:Uncharacterized protein n=1 Tax=Oryza meyeriana var. granulata TaxID=110450 RepID=A0A6G1ESC0_9ORYZ|nr:hypothetical protein E2562_034262 [Oryza meyeriana var. granulata]